MSILMVIMENDSYEPMHQLVINESMRWVTPTSSQQMVRRLAISMVSHGHMRMSDDNQKHDSDIRHSSWQMEVHRLL
jgi:hypothetical protein